MHAVPRSSLISDLCSINFKEGQLRLIEFLLAFIKVKIDLKYKVFFSHHECLFSYRCVNNKRGCVCFWFLCCRLCYTEKRRCWSVNAIWPWFITCCLRFPRICHMRHSSAEQETSLSSSLPLKWPERLPHTTGTQLSRVSTSAFY